MCVDIWKTKFGYKKLRKLFKPVREYDNPNNNDDLYKHILLLIHNKKILTGTSK